MMVKLSYLPGFVKVLFVGMPGVWKSRHLLVLYWLVFLQAVVPGRKTIAELSRWSPAHIPEWRLRRVLKAGYWTLQQLVTWWADEAIICFPPPSDGVVYLVGDGSKKDKRGTRNPVVQKGKKHRHAPWFVGIRFSLLIVCWNVYRIPVGFRLILPKDHPHYRNENTLFREMVVEYCPPAWAHAVIVVGDAGYGSAANMKMVQSRHAADPDRAWYFVFAIARTWKQVNGKSLKNFVTYLPRALFRKSWIYPSNQEGRRKTFWVFRKQMTLRHVGDVTVVLSKKWRNLGPKQTKILVTNLPGATTRQVLAIYQRRWAVELLFKELKSGVGLGEHQITKDEPRVEHSFGVAILAYLLLLRAGHEEIVAGHAWSLFQLQQTFRMRVITNQIQHSMELKMKKQFKGLS
jgi:hypothetical protein